MPIVKKVKGKKSQVREEAESAPVEVSLPKKLSAPLPRLADYSFLLYGERKIGKTTMWSHAENTFYMMCEPGGRALRIYQKPVPDWQSYLAYLDLLEKDTFYKTVVVDTADICYDLAFDYCCQRLGIEHPNDENDFGKSWGIIEREFSKGMQRLLALQKGVVLISHATLREVRQHSGESITRIEPTMASQARKVLVSMIDVWAYYGYEGKSRVIVIEGDESIGAGNRLEENFHTPSGKRVRSIPAGTSSEAAYRNLVRAFDNQQQYPTAKQVRHALASHKKESE